MTLVISQQKIAHVGNFYTLSSLKQRMSSKSLLSTVSNSIRVTLYVSHKNGKLFSLTSMLYNKPRTSSAENNTSFSTIGLPEISFPRNSTVLYGVSWWIPGFSYFSDVHVWAALWLSCGTFCIDPPGISLSLLILWLPSLAISRYSWFSSLKHGYSWIP